MVQSKANGPPCSLVCGMRPLPIGEPKASGLPSHMLEWSLETTGNLLQVKAKFVRPPRSLPKKRGVVRGFSHQARIRMLQMISKIDWEKVPDGLFVTLTVPDECWPMTRSARNIARAGFMRYVEAFHGNHVPAIWRIEWKARKTGKYRGKLLPHFHLVIFGVPYIHHSMIRGWWRSLLKAESALATDVQSLKGKQHHAVYVAKYAAKIADSSSLDSLAYLSSAGRHWGVHRPRLMPFHETEIFDGFTDKQIDQIKALGREAFAWYGEYAELGFTMFGKVAEKYREAIIHIALDTPIENR